MTDHASLTTASTTTDDNDAPVLDEQARLSRLVVHLSRLVNRGGRVEQQDRYLAVVSMPRRLNMLPNAAMAAVGIALFVWLSEPFFLLGAGAAFLGWHRKLVAGAERFLVAVRVDDLGRITERELEPA